MVLSPLPFWIWLLLGVSYAAGITFVVTGFSVLSRNSRSWVNRTFFVYSLVKAFWVFVATTILWYPDLATARVLYNFWWIGLLLFTFYFLAFGLNIMPFVKSAWRLPIFLIATALGLGVGFVWIQLLQYDVRATDLGWVWLPDLPLFFVGVFAFVISYAVGLWGLMMAELQIADEKSQSARKAMFWALFAHMAAAGFFVLTYRMFESYWLLMFAPIANMVLLPIAAARFWALRSEK